MATNKRSNTDIADSLDHDLAFCRDLATLLVNQDEQITTSPIAVFDELSDRLEKIKMNSDELWRRFCNATKKPKASIA